MTYYFVLLLKIASVSATSITLEKESRTWPILLTTAIDDNQIVAGKIFGSFLICWPLLLLLFGHIIFFTVIRCIHPAAIILMLPLAVSTCLLFTSTGVLFSSMVKRSSTASILNLSLFLFVSFPICCMPCGSGPLPAFISPMFYAFQILFPTCGAEAAGSSIGMLDYETFDYARGFGNLAAITLIMILVHGTIIIVSYVICRDGIRAKIFKGEK